MESAPIFVKINKYKELSGVLKKIQERVEITNKTLDQLETLRDQEEKSIQQWKENVELIQGKLSAVGTALHQNK